MPLLLLVVRHGIDDLLRLLRYLPDGATNSVYMGVKESYEVRSYRRSNDEV